MGDSVLKINLNTYQKGDSKYFPIRINFKELQKRQSANLQTHVHGGDRLQEKALRKNRNGTLRNQCCLRPDDRKVEFH